MSKTLLGKLITCIFILCGFLYIYIDKQNALIELKIEIPKLSQCVRQLEEENTSLSFKIEQLESPDRLIELLKQKEYSHLKYPYLKEVLSIDRDLE